MTPRNWKAQSAEAFARQLALPQQRRLFDYWLQRCSDHRWPMHGEIRPADLRDLLANIIIIEPRPMPEGLRVKLAGSALWDIYGREITGGTLEHCLMGPHCDYWRRIYDGLLAEPLPDCGHLRDDARMNVLFWMRLPVLADNGNTWLLGLDIAMPQSRVAHLRDDADGEAEGDASSLSSGDSTAAAQLDWLPS